MVVGVRSLSDSTTVVADVNVGDGVGDMGVDGLRACGAPLRPVGLWAPSAKNAMQPAATTNPAMRAAMAIRLRVTK